MKRLRPADFLALKHITVLLADDHAGFRKSLKLLVEAEGDIKVIGEAKNGCEAVRLHMSLHPEVVVMDLAMPLMNGLQATRQIMMDSPAAKVLILSAHPDPEYIKQAKAMGASGYLIKQSSTQDLAKAIRDVRKGGTCFSSAHCNRQGDESQRRKEKLV